MSSGNPKNLTDDEYKELWSGLGPIEIKMVEDRKRR